MVNCRNHPVHTTLFITNLIACVCAVCLGCWIVFIRNRAESEIDYNNEIKENGVEIDEDERTIKLRLKESKAGEFDESIEKAEQISLVALILCIITFVFAGYLAKRAFDLLLMLCPDCCPMFNGYRAWMRKDYVHCMDESKNPVTLKSEIGRYDHDIDELDEDISHVTTTRSLSEQKHSKEHSQDYRTSTFNDAQQVHHTSSKSRRTSTRTSRRSHTPRTSTRKSRMRSTNSQTRESSPLASDTAIRAADSPVFYSSTSDFRRTTTPRTVSRPTTKRHTNEPSETSFVPSGSQRR